jgi:purine-nucleoside phosphorylase
MSTPHIDAEAGQIAPRVLLPGDPRRAEWIAETFLDDPVCYTRVRNMLGFTGTYRGTPVSVQGTGMVMPSISIYVSELLDTYGVRQLVRVGSCGALTERLRVRDVVLAIGASTDSSMNRIRFGGLDYSAVADFDLLVAAHRAAVQREIPVTVGTVFSADSFYSDRPELMQTMVGYGVVAVEMEANALYTLAAGRQARALAVCTVSDQVITGERASSDDRERSFGQMVEIGLDATIAVPLDG